MSKKIYELIMKGGIYLSLVSVLLVYNGFLFPYITTKQIYFNIVIEVISIFWIVYLLKYPSERPRKTGIAMGLLAYFGVVLLSCFTGVDFNLSFWGDVERMLGFFHIVHFLVFYFIVITVFKDWKDWKLLFIFSIMLAGVVSYYGIVGKAYSTIGNTAYVAGYMIFNMYFALILFFKEERKKMRWIYIAVLPLLFKAFLIASSAGATVGLGVSILVALFVYGLFGKNEKIRKLTFRIGIVAVFIIILVFSNRELIKDVPLLSEITVEKNTFQTRLISWRAAMKDMPNHLFLGTGFGNYAITFDKFFAPNFYDFTRSETYFDRAHNNIIEIASTTGLLGLVAYLSIFFAVGLSLMRAIKKKNIQLNDFVLIVAVLVGYFIQNLAVFDSLVTFIALMMVLGYVYFLTNKRKQKNDFEVVVGDIKENNVNDKQYVNSKNEWSILALVGVVILAVVFEGNIGPIKMLRSTIDAQIAFAQGDPEGGYEHYKLALSHNTGLDRDSKNTFVREAGSRINSLNALGEEKAKEIIEYALMLMQENIELNPLDSLNQLQYSQLLRSVAVYYINTDPSKALEYFKKADVAVDESIKASPGRIRIYYSKAQILLSSGNTEEAISVLKFAASLNENYYDSFCHLGSIQIVSSKEEDGYENIDKCLDMNGQSVLAQPQFIVNFIKHYQKSEDNIKIIKLFERLSELEPQNTSVLIELAKYYALNGQSEKAVDVAQKASVIDPGLKEAAQEFANTIMLDK